MNCFKLCLFFGSAASVVAAPRENVNVEGTTMPPEYERLEDTAAQSCPDSHPFPVDNYQKCCSSSTRVAPCDGSSELLGTDSAACCQDSQPAACLGGKTCKTHYKEFEGEAFFWSEWSEWSGCQGSCSSPAKVRNRVCLLSEYCTGNSTETDSTSCNAMPCASWTTWSSWSSCSATCSTSATTRTRTRTCQNENEWNTCDGEGSEVDMCPSLIPCDCLDIDKDYNCGWGCSTNNLGWAIWAHSNKPNVFECQQHCQQEADCQVWSWVLGNGECWLKYDEGSPEVKSGTHSGPKYC